ncbi:MAG: hypothetical protein QOF11_2570 [Chloroflexota bacterium]|jgi:hypothetical protein|nr:hypothetical protein [Chloroflexota bacterium]
MNATTRSIGNAANAVIALDCPWCAEPVRATVNELVDGLACPACLVQVELADEPHASRIVIPVAA